MAITVEELEQLLYEYPLMSKKINDLNKELNDAVKCHAELVAELYNPLRVSATTSMPQNSLVNDPTFNAVMQIEKATKKFHEHILYLTSRLTRKMDNKVLIDTLWSKLGEPERRIIDLRYFQNMRWFMVSRKAHYSISQCCAIRNNAIKKMIE